jgi:hypothetical protein
VPPFYLTRFNVCKRACSRHEYTVKDQKSFRATYTISLYNIFHIKTWFRKKLSNHFLLDFHSAFFTEIDIVSSSYNFLLILFLFFSTILFLFFPTILFLFFPTISFLFFPTILFLFFLTIYFYFSLQYYFYFSLQYYFYFSLQYYFYFPLQYYLSIMLFYCSPFKHKLSFFVHQILYYTIIENCHAENLHLCWNHKCL